MERLTNNALAQADVVRGAVNSDGRGLLTHGILVDLKIVLNKRVVERPVTAESVHALVNGERELRAADLSGTDLLRATVQSGAFNLMPVSPVGTCRPGPRSAVNVAPGETFLPV